jgi:hypothetical protein
MERWERGLLIGLLAAFAGLAVYVLWDDWKIRQERARARPDLAVVEDQVADHAEAEA